MADNKAKSEVKTIRGRPMDIYMQLVDKYHSGNGWAVKRGSLNQVIVERSVAQSDKEIGSQAEDVKDDKEPIEKATPKKVVEVKSEEPTEDEAVTKKTTTRKTTSKK